MGAIWPRGEVKLELYRVIRVLAADVFTSNLSLDLVFPEDPSHEIPLFLDGVFSAEKQEGEAVLLAPAFIFNPLLLPTGPMLVP